MQSELNNQKKNRNRFIRVSKFHPVKKLNDEYVRDPSDG